MLTKTMINNIISRYFFIVLEIISTSCCKNNTFLIETAIGCMMVPGTAVFDSRIGIVGVLMACSPTILQFRHRVIHRSRRLRLLV
jgi:hypothetical protein